MREDELDREAPRRVTERRVRFCVGEIASAFFPAIFLTGGNLSAIASTKIGSTLHSTRNTRSIKGDVRRFLSDAQSHESARKPTETLKTGFFLYVFKKS